MKRAVDHLDHRELPDCIPGTAGEDVMTVHKVRDGRPVCGAIGEVAEWRRAISCSACITTG